MKSLLSSLGVLTLGLAGLAFILLPSPVHAVTITVTGWLVPDGTHFNNGIGALLFPIIGVGLFAGMGKVLDLEGDFGVTLILAGLTVGGAIGMLQIGASSSNVLPFALVVVPGVDLLVWMWKGGG
jgi:hypothetical protein